MKAKKTTTQEAQSAEEEQPSIETSQKEVIEQSKEHEYIGVIKHGEGLDLEDASTTGIEQRSVGGSRS